MSVPAGGDVCRVPLDDPANAGAVAAAFGGAYHESSCGFLQKCSGLHVHYTSAGAGTQLATWYSCEIDTWQAGLVLAAVLLAVAAVVFVVRRLRRRADGRADGRADAEPEGVTRREARH